VKKPSATPRRAANPETLQAEVATLRDKLAEETKALEATEKRLGEWQSAHATIKESLKDQRKENQALRDELHASELRCAELQGYVKALSDTEPAPMVPAQMPRHIEQLMRGEARDTYASFNRERPLSWWNRGRS
jgi:chromosome segregation ATPase